MPVNTHRNQTQWVQSGNPETVNEATALSPGQLGSCITYGGKEYQFVQLDSGATALNTVGVVADKQLAFWKDRTTYLVSNDLRMSQEGRNGVAGVFHTAVTAGYYCFIQKRGISTVASEASNAIGDVAIAYSGTDARVTYITAGTAPTYKIVGQYRTVASANVATVNLALVDDV